MMTNPLELVVNDIDIITTNLQESVNAIYGLDEVSYKDLDEIISDIVSSLYIYLNGWMKNFIYRRTLELFFLEYLCFIKNETSLSKA